ncbi:MAG: DUF512 domain-containing protein [Clostridia bacterium]|nr:DUF512 domain-containing protein [Clostridia bacterium]
MDECKNTERNAKGGIFLVTVTDVLQDSIAANAGILRGDVLISINGNEICDVLDYRFYLTEANVTLTLSRGGAAYSVTLEKDPYDDVGLCFETPLMDEKHTCRNGCIFCFIDQLPKGLRDTLYFKDDDSRLSFLHGNYITLTNLTDADVDRMVKMRFSPVNISVHTTNPELRVRMMKNKRAGAVLSYLRRLADAGITLRCQIVLCRGVNDGDELSRTLSDLAEYYPALDSVSIVPAGLTAHRDGLYPLSPYSPAECAAIVRQIESFANAHFEKTGSRLFFAADELYIKAGLPLPAEEAYEGYPQIENGVGMLRSMSEEFDAALKTRRRPLFRRIRRTVSVATGVAAAPYLSRYAKAAEEKYKGLKVNVFCIENNFFGKEITVAGLLTGQDIAEQLKGQPLGDLLLIPRTALRSEGDLFLCGMSKDELSQRLGVRVLPVDCDGGELLDLILKG